MSRNKAVKELVDHNNRIVTSPSNIEAEAIDRLLSALIEAKAANTASKAEKIMKLVKDLDVVFFGGVLWGHIQVSWSGSATLPYHKGKAVLGWVVGDVFREEREVNVLYQAFAVHKLQPGPLQDQPQ